MELVQRLGRPLLCHVAMIIRQIFRAKKWPCSEKMTNFVEKSRRREVSINGIVYITINKFNYYSFFDENNDNTLGKPR